MDEQTYRGEYRRGDQIETDRYRLSILCVDAYTRVKYTRAVRCGLAVLIVLSLSSLQIQSLAFHVHDVPDHAENREHQHGPAIHHHDDIDSLRHVDEEERSTAGTVMPIAIAAATTSVGFAVVAMVADTLPTPQLRLMGDAPTIDVRSHGPPQSRSDFLRGPPTSIQS